MLANGENGAPVAAPPASKPRATKETKDKNPPIATGPVPSASSAADVAAATNELKKQADQMRVAKEQAEIKVRACCIWVAIDLRLMGLACGCRLITWNLRCDRCPSE